ncbi:MAG: rhombosortase [Verrucomicrobia bacterium]|nr:rhombosortase [Verrucomicrobiota bacterium]
MTTDTASTPRRRLLPWASGIAVALALGAFFWPGAAADFGYDRPALLRGEWWRLATAHWVHLKLGSLLWNLAVLIPASLWAEQIAPRRLRLLLLLAPWGIGAALFFLDPQVQVYTGLSAVVIAVLGFLTLTQLRTHTPDPWFWRSVLALLVLKIIVEFAAGRPTFAQTALAHLPVTPLADLAGLLCATIAARRRKPELKGSGL